MRLIDADKLFEWCKDNYKDKYPIGDQKQFEGIMFYEVYQEIEDAETVEAIPVEWLLKKYPVNAKYASESYHSKAKIIRDLIKEWRKENEKSDSNY